MIAAVDEMEFDKFVKPLESALDQWKGEQNRKKEEKKKKDKVSHSRTDLKVWSGAKIRST